MLYLISYQILTRVTIQSINYNNKLIRLNNMKGKYLITTDGWFFAPDGRQYKSVWGEVEIFEDSILGVKTNRNASNWYAKVGTEKNHIIIAGCQIHYALKTEVKPNTDIIKDFNTGDYGVINFERPTLTYIAE